MQDDEFWAAQFEEHRPRLRAVAYRMLGSVAEAEDAVQEAWLRVSRASGDDVDNVGGWLTTIVSRQCLAGVVGDELRHEVVLVRGDGTVHGVDVALVQRSQALDERIISERACRAHPQYYGSARRIETISPCRVRRRPSPGSGDRLPDRGVEPVPDVDRRDRQEQG